jgi:hypothetical protein
VESAKATMAAGAFEAKASAMKVAVHVAAMLAEGKQAAMAMVEAKKAAVHVAAMLAEGKQAAMAMVEAKKAATMAATKKAAAWQYAAHGCGGPPIG